MIHSRLECVPYQTILKINIEVTNEEAIKILKNCKSHGMDDITNKMIKYGSAKSYAEIVKLMQSIFIRSQIPV